MASPISFLKERSKKQWLVVYTRSRSEKKTDALLKKQGIISYCPTIKVKKQWADRKKLVEVPLFNSYLFVYVDAFTKVTVQSTMGVVNFVLHCGIPVTLTEDEVARIREIVTNYSDSGSLFLQTLKAGDKITIKDGAFSELSGEVDQVMGKKVLMIIKNLNCALVVKVDIEQVTLN